MLAKLLAIVQILNGGVIVAGNLYFLSKDADALVPVLLFGVVGALFVWAGLAMLARHRSSTALNYLLCAIWILLTIAFANAEGISFEEGLRRFKSLYVLGVLALQIAATVVAVGGRSAVKGR